jgi:hypothetical protein
VEEINMYDSLNDNSEPQMSNEDLAKEIQRLSRKLDESNNLKMDKISKPNGSGLIKAGGIMTLVISCLAFIAVGIATLFTGMIFMAFLNVLSIPSIVLNALAISKKSTKGINIAAGVFGLLFSIYFIGVSGILMFVGTNQKFA